MLKILPAVNKKPLSKCDYGDIVRTEGEETFVVTLQNTYCNHVQNYGSNSGRLVVFRASRVHSSLVLDTLPPDIMVEVIGKLVLEV